MKNFLFKRLNQLLLLSCLACAADLHAAEDVDIYTVDIAVTDQSAAEREQAMGKGLIQVLIRASGSDSVNGNEFIQSFLNKARSFIQQYAYQQVNATRKAAVESRWLLHLTFEASSIQRLLADAGLPVWAKRRPLVLLWAAQETKDGRQIVSLGSEEGAKIERWAKERAIPFALPLMDLEDASQVELIDIWGRFSSPVILASKRYQADVVVLGRVQAVGEKWRSDWQFIIDNEHSSWSQISSSRELAYQQLIAEIGRRLCAQFCVMPTLMGENQMLVAISNLNSLFDAAKAEKYLQSLLPVRTIDLIELNQQQALFRLKLMSRKEAVLEAISLDASLFPLPGVEPIGTEPRIYNFSWSN